MVSIKWCINQKKGIEIIKSNPNMADSYIKMAEESITALNAVKQSKMWTAVTAYYIFYQSLYALMLKIGIKCEIHACTIEFMRTFLSAFYNKQDNEAIQKAFNARQDLQYYADRPVDPETIKYISKYSKEFYTKTKNIMIRITETQINTIRKEIQKSIKNSKMRTRHYIESRP